MHDKTIDKKMESQHLVNSFKHTNMKLMKSLSKQ